VVPLLAHSLPIRPRSARERGVSHLGHGDESRPVSRRGRDVGGWIIRRGRTGGGVCGSRDGQRFGG
jgi:hypothetical protein